MATQPEDQKAHMDSLIKQAKELNSEVNQLQQKLQFKRDVLLKVQGAVEYLQQCGVPIPQDAEAVEETEAESAS